MSHNSGSNDYSRYFKLRQKVYLINMSEERNSDIYESLSGIVTFSSLDTLKLAITHDGHGIDGEGTVKTTYKLTSEALGSGIQILADLTGITAGNIFELRLYGTLELFQRRSVPRVELSTEIFHLRGKFPLATFKKKWKQVMDQLGSNPLLPGLVLQKTAINLSAGGVGLTVDPANRPTPLSMFFIALDDKVPICALAETVWEQHADEGLRCGFRFIHILKTDQDRINRHISNVLRESGGTHLDYKRNWELVDKMQTDTHKPE